MNELWCGNATAHGRHEWIGHHGRRMDCPGDDGTRGTLRDALVIRRIDGDYVPPWGGLIVSTDAAVPVDSVFITPLMGVSEGDVFEGEEVGPQGYARMKITDWPELREPGEFVTFGAARLGECDEAVWGGGRLIDVLWEPVEVAPDAWARILELGERSAAGQLQPAEASEAPVAVAPASDAPLTPTWGVCPGCGGRHDGDCY